MILPKSLLNNRLSPSRTIQTPHVHRRDQHILHERHEGRGPLARNAPRSVVYLKHHQRNARPLLCEKSFLKFLRDPMDPTQKAKEKKNLRDQCQGEVIFGDICHGDHNERRPEGKDGVDDRAAAVAGRVVEKDGGEDQPQGNEEGEQDLHDAVEEIGWEDEDIAVASFGLEKISTQNIALLLDTSFFFLPLFPAHFLFLSTHLWVEELLVWKKKPFLASM